MDDMDQRKFLQQRREAKKRGIDWLLTYEQWQQWWDATGHYHDRGRKNNQYVMARIGDTGPYSLDNIECITAAQNKEDAKQRGLLGRKPAGYVAPKHNANPIQVDTGIARNVKPAKVKFKDLPIEQQQAIRKEAAQRSAATRLANGTARGGRPKGSTVANGAKKRETSWSKGKKLGPHSEERRRANSEGQKRARARREMEALGWTMVQ